MRPRNRKRRFVIMMAGLALGLFIFMACDGPDKAPEPKPKVVSKQISLPGSASGANKADPSNSELTKGKDTPQPSTDKAGPAVALPGSVTEDQVRREQAEARAKSEAQNQSEALALVSAETQAEAQNQSKGQVQEKVESPPDTMASPLLFQSEEKYDFKDRVDPFIPLISERRDPAPAAAAKEAKPERVLTPLEKMELSQIKLVAVLQSSKGTIAMVEEASGKGYEVRIGTYMGRNGGRVSAISPDGLLVKEFYTDYRGERLERVEEIKFHKNEGGE